MTLNARFSADVLIIGSGAAGLALALQLPQSTRVLVLSKDVIVGPYIMVSSLRFSTMM